MSAWDVTPGYKVQARTSHQVDVKLEVLDESGDVAYTYPIVGGDVTIRANAAVRRQATILASADEDIIPTPVIVPAAQMEKYDAQDQQYGEEGDTYGSHTIEYLKGIFTPYGTEFKVSHAIFLEELGTWEWVPMGVYGITDVGFAESIEGIIMRLEGDDRSASIAERRRVTPYTIPVGREYAQAVRDMLLERRSDLTFVWESTGVYTNGPMTFDAKSDPWKDATKMLNDVGFVIYFDGEGVCRIEPSPETLSGTPVWDVTDGEDGIIEELENNLTNNQVYNGVVVQGEGTNLISPAYAVQWDMNPNSPTRANGPYGERPRFYTSDFIANEVQATTTAVKMLSEMLGRDDQIQISAYPYAPLDASDLVFARSSRSKILANYRIVEAKIPLDVESNMTLTLWRKRLPQ